MNIPTIQVLYSGEIMDRYKLNVMSLLDINEQEYNELWEVATGMALCSRLSTVDVIDAIVTMSTRKTPGGKDEKSTETILEKKDNKRRGRTSVKLI
jgi:hypothetical protein